jgi:hypothetical protein
MRMIVARETGCMSIRILPTRVHVPHLRVHVTHLLPTRIRPFLCPTLYLTHTFPPSLSAETLRWGHRLPLEELEVLEQQVLHQCGMGLVVLWMLAAWEEGQDVGEGGLFPRGSRRRQVVLKLVARLGVSLDRLPLLLLGGVGVAYRSNRHGRRLQLTSPPRWPCLNQRAAGCGVGGGCISEELVGTRVHVCIKTVKYMYVQVSPQAGASDSGGGGSLSGGRGAGGAGGFSSGGFIGGGGGDRPAASGGFGGGGGGGGVEEDGGGGGSFAEKMMRKMGWKEGKVSFWTWDIIIRRVCQDGGAVL